MRDAVDQVLDQWAREHPELDVSPMGVIGRISRAAAVLDRRIAQTFAAFDLQPGEFDVLATLRRAGAPYRLTVGELLSRAMVTSGAVTHRLNRLEAKNLIRREIDPANRRSIIVTLTPEGLNAVEAALIPHVDYEHDLLSSLTHRQRDQLANLLRTLLLGFGDTEA